MNKQSLIHLHALLTNVREDLAAREEVPEGVYREYEQYGVRHTSIHRSKGSHEEAVWLLLDGIDQTIGEEAERPTTVTSDD